MCFTIIQGSRPAKLEKADILEMTVQHLQWLHEQQKQLTQVTATDTGETASLKLQQKKQTKTYQQSHTHTNKIQVKTQYEHKEECDPLILDRPCLAVPSTTYKCQKKSGQMEIKQGVQRRYYEGHSRPNFHAGFSECVRQAQDMLQHFDGVEPALCKRLLNHLASCLDSLENSNNVTSSSSNHQAADSTQNNVAEEIKMVSSASLSVLIEPPMGLTLLPTKLPNGDLAFVIPADVKKSVTHCMQNQTAQNCHTAPQVEEYKNLQEGVWRPW
jgi:Hairy Orange.